LKYPVLIVVAGLLSAHSAFAQVPTGQVGEDISRLRFLEQPPEGGELRFIPPAPAPTIYADQLSGADVFSSEGQDIGRIADIVYTEDGNIEAAVVTVEGFWGFGRHSVKIPMAELTVNPPIGPRGVFAVLLPLTRDQVRAMPAYRGRD
jgi:sporulation protein YlmC with PRC-barrel domain